MRKSWWLLVERARECLRVHPELCRIPADLMRPARPRRQFPNLIPIRRTGVSEKSLRRSCWLLVIPCAAWLQAEMVLSNFRTALCGRRPPVGLHFAGLTHPSSIVTHFLANLGSDLREACPRLHPEPCRMPADQIRPARPRRPTRPKRPVMISRLSQVTVSRASIPGVRGARRGLLPAGPPLEKRVSPVSAFPSGPSAPWPLEPLACDRLPQLANLGLHFAGLTHPSPIVLHLLTNLGSDLKEACLRVHPEPCRIPANLMRPARPRRQFPNLISIQRTGESE